MAWQDGAAKTHLKSVGPAAPDDRNRSGGRFRGFVRLEALARPRDMHHGAVIGKGPVAERDFRAGALQQRAGDENTEPEAAMPALVLIRAAPPRQLGLAYALQHVGRETRNLPWDEES